MSLFNKEDITILSEEMNNIEAIVSLNQVITLEEFLEMKEKYGLDVDWIRYLSSEGGGKIAFKDGEDIATKIQNLSNDFKEDYGSDFDLVVGVGAFRAIFSSKMVETLLRDNCVLIADCGPMNNEPGFPETTHDTIIVNRWYDIFQEYVKLIEDGVITKN